MSNEDALMTSREVAKVTGRSPETINNWLSRGSYGVVLPSQRIGNYRIVRQSDLDEFLKSISEKADKRSKVGAGN